MAKVFTIIKNLFHVTCKSHTTARYVRNDILIPIVIKAKFRLFIVNAASTVFNHFAGIFLIAFK